MRKFIWTLICGFLFVVLVSCGTPEGSSAETSADSLPETAVTTAAETVVTTTAITTTTAPAITTVSKEDAYLEALACLDAGKIEEAYDHFLTVKGYRDVDEYLDRFVFLYETRIEKSSSGATTVLREYDTYGNILSDVYFATSNNSMITYTYKYDDHCNLIEKVSEYASSFKDVTRYEYDENNMPVRMSRSSGFFIELEYDDKGNIVKQTDDYGDATVYTYDENGNILTEISMHKDGETLYHVTYEYDAKGHCVKITKDSMVITNHYDESGNCVKQEIVQSNGISYYHEYEYDAMGNCTKNATYHPQWDEFVIFTFKYDESGNMTEERRVDEKGLDYTEAYEYDDGGKVMKFTYTDHKNGSVSEMAYTYDAYGNLLKVSDIQSGETLTAYIGYKLYYNPFEVRELPTAFVGVG